MNKRSGYMYLHILIALFISAAIRMLVHPAGSLTMAGVLALSVCIPVIYLWITVDTVWPSLLVFVLISLTGTYESAGDVCAVSIGNSAVIFTVACMILSNILTENGIMNRCASFLLSRKIINKKPYMFLFMFYLSIMILCNFLENVSLLIITIGFIDELIPRMGIKKHSDFSNAMYLGALWLCATTGMCSPISKVIPMLLIGMLPQKISLFTWWSYGLIIEAVIFAVLMFVVVCIWKPAGKDSVELPDIKYDMGRMSKKEIITLTALLLIILMWILPDAIPAGKFPALVGTLKKIGNFGPALLGIVFLGIIRVDGQPVADIVKAMKKVPLTLIFFVSAVFLVSNVTSSPATGIRDFLYETIVPHVRAVPYFVIFILMLVLTLCVTNLTSDILTAMLFSQISLTLFADSSYPPLFLLMFVGMAASMSILTPSAGVPTSIMYSTGNLKIAQVWKYSFMMVVLNLIILTAIAYPLFNA